MFRLTRYSVRRVEGFTLIEVVVTLAVIAAVLASIGSLMAVNVRSTRAVDEHLATVETARAIETALPDRNSLAVGTLAGETGGQRWRVDVQPFGQGFDANSRSPWLPLSATVAVVAPGGTLLRVTTLRLRRKAAQ